MAAKGDKTTPLMKQFNGIKAKYPDALLLFRVGDFYETFGDDAEKAASILDIVLTQRNNGGDKTALAGFPHHALNTYLPKLVKAGQRVAICDQLEDPKQPVEILRTIHSFDPCIACAVHTLDVEGNEIGSVRTL